MTTIAGKYEVIRKLGEGGIGSVFLVRHRLLQVNYALKLLNEDVSRDDHVIASFKQEAEILFRFTHPGSVQLRDFGRTDDGHYYMTMDYCLGETLTHELAKRGQFSINESLDIVHQILSVLEAAHNLGIVHRDIKPDNILLLEDSEKLVIKVLDFGIASLKERLGVDSPDAPGITVGTPEYMAPEQASGEKIYDHRVDIYATGILFFELLSGKVPFAGKDVVETLLMQLIQPLDQLPVELNIPIVVEELIAKATRKEPDKRFQSAVEFLAAVDETSKLLAGDPDSLKNLQILESQNEKERELPDTSDSEKTDPNSTKILCLDDDPLLLNITKYLYEKEGFQVYCASSFSSIHSYLFEVKIDLLLCDVNLPGLSGTRICQMIKQSLPEVSIYLFSNVPERELEKLARSCGADGYISKNWSPAQWVETVKDALATSIQKSKF